jgi:hypothetical protein
VNQLPARLALGFVVLAFCCFDPIKTSAQPGDPNFLRGSKTMRPRSLNSVAFGNNLFVAIGGSSGSGILTSKDGKDWKNRSSEACRSVTVNINYASETFVANGDSVTFISFKDLPPTPASDESLKNQGNPGEPQHQVPADSANPRTQAHPPPNLRPSIGLRAVTFGGGEFVIVGDSGEILTSRDGEQWTVQASGSTDTLIGITCGSSGFVVVGDHGTILTSQDGTKWTRRISGTEQRLLGVAYGNGTFVALGEGSTILASTDGIQWTSEDIGPETMKSIAFGNGIFMGMSVTHGLVGKVYPDGHQTMVSKDGKNWHEVQHPYSPRQGQVRVPTLHGFPGGTTSLNFGGGLFIATSVEGIYTSKDGEVWNASEEPNGSKGCYGGAAFGHGLYVAVGNGLITGPNHTNQTRGLTIATSKTGDVWELSETPPSRLMLGDFIDGSIYMIGMPKPGEDVNLVPVTREKWMTPDNTPVFGNISGNQLVYGSDDHAAVFSSNDGIIWTRLSPKYSDRPTTLAGLSTGSSSRISSKSALPAVAGNAPENGVVINLNGKGYKLNLAANNGQLYKVQASTNLQDWVTLATITNSGAMLNFTDHAATNYPIRFYRLEVQ